MKDKTKYDNFYSSSESEAEITINKSDIKNVFKSIYTTITANMENLQEKVRDGLLIQSLNILLVFQSIISYLEAVI